MSYKLTKEEILFRQRFLCACELYAGELDGIWGNQTTEADEKFVEESVSILSAHPFIDARSEANISTLVLPAQVVACEFMDAATALMNEGEAVKILSGNRTYAEQNVIYAQGRTRKGDIVTNARGGQSNHNFGIAWDIGIFKNGVYVDRDDKPYIALAHKLMPTPFPSLEWGGNWHKADNPHYNLKSVSAKISEVRTNFETGKKYF